MDIWGFSIGMQKSKCNIRNRKDLHNHLKYVISTRTHKCQGTHRYRNHQNLEWILRAFFCLEIRGKALSLKLLREKFHRNWRRDNGANPPLWLHTDQDHHLGQCQPILHHFQTFLGQRLSQTSHPGISRYLRHRYMGFTLQCTYLTSSVLFLS